MSADQPKGPRVLSDPEQEVLRRTLMRSAKIVDPSDRALRDKVAERIGEGFASDLPITEIADLVLRLYRAHFQPQGEPQKFYAVPIEHEGRMVYDISDTPIPMADNWMLYASPPRSVADGWKLVPVEPTHEMGKAGRKACAEVADRMEAAKETAVSVIDFWQKVGHNPEGAIWSAMIAAAPLPSPSAEPSASEARSDL